MRVVVRACYALLNCRGGRVRVEIIIRRWRGAEVFLNFIDLELADDLAVVDRRQRWRNYLRLRVRKLLKGFIRRWFGDFRLDEAFHLAAPADERINLAVVLVIADVLLWLALVLSVEQDRRRVSHSHVTRVVAKDVFARR